MKNASCRLFGIFLLCLVSAFPAFAAEPEVNVYSARHYAVDEILFGNFTKETGIKVNVINGKAPELVKASPNKDNAIRRVEFLLSPASRKLLSEENCEYPVNPEAEMALLLKSWGAFEVQKLDFAVYSDNNPKAIQIFSRAGWK